MTARPVVEISLRFTLCCLVPALAAAPAAAAPVTPATALTAAARVAPAAERPALTGDYLEVRTSDVWTGSCFANGEVGLAGQEAILAWRVREGAWQGVDLAGRSVVAVVTASATLGDPHADPLPARSVLLVDEAASPEQRTALADFAREAGGGLIEDVVAVLPEAIEISVHDGAATLAAGSVAEVRTRPLGHHDSHCGNEERYYPPLTGKVSAEPGTTVVHAWRGGELGRTWSSPGKRSAYVGTFER